ncbi:hypothetical protein NTB16_001866 [Neisseria gonorrhoeae]
MPSEPSDGIFDAPAVYRHGGCRLNLQTAFLTRPPFTGTGQVRGNTRTAIADTP